MIVKPIHDREASHQSMCICMTPMSWDQLTSHSMQGFGMLLHSTVFEKEELVVFMALCKTSGDATGARNVLGDVLMVQCMNSRR